MVIWWHRRRQYQSEGMEYVIFGGGLFDIIKSEASVFTSDEIDHRSNRKPLRSLKAMEEYGTLLTVITSWKMRGPAIGETLREWIGDHINQDKLIS